MGYFGKLEEKQLAQKLRRKGLSYTEILQYISVSKDTLSHWCRNIILFPNQLERLKMKKLLGSERGRIIGAKIQQQRRLKETKRLLADGVKELGILSQRERFIAGIALYLGEGQKNDRNVGFSNSDPKTIKFMIEWFREFCNVPESKLRGAIWIHDNLDPVKAKKYWSTLTDIPEQQFYKTYISKNKTESRKIRKHVHQFGIFSIRFTDAKIHRKLMGWMAGLTQSQMI